MKKHYAVIGDPVNHSRSPELYAPLFEKAGIDADFLRLRVTKEELPRIREIVFENGLSGFAVTMPHKRAIIPYLDALDESAERAGSVNIVTVENEGKRLVGHNTDGEGLVNALSEAGVSVEGKSVVILGNGGAAAGARAAIERHGGSVRIITREHMRCGAVLPIEAVMQNAERDEGLLSNADVLINATPLGMAGGEDFRRLDFIEYLKPSCAVFDMVYRPDGEDTSLLAVSKAAGLTAIDGERLLYHQGLLAFRLWTGIDAAPTRKGAKMRTALAQYESKVGDIGFNTDQIVRALAACSGKAELVMFGESFLQGFDAFVSEYEHDLSVAIPADGELMRRIAALSRGYGVDLIFGYFERDGADLYSSCAVIIDGRLAHNYRRISKGWKEYSITGENYKEGDSALSFDYRGQKFTIALCGDMFDFPEKFKTDGTLLWPVYLSYSPEDWAECRQEYAEQAALAAKRALVVNPIVHDEWPALGGTFDIENGKIKAELPFGKEGLLFVEV